MATNLPYTLQVLQDRINTLVENDSDTPDSDDDEWTARLNLIYQAIGNWETQDVFWRELWTTYTHGSVIVAGDRDYSLSFDDFRYPGGFVRLTLNGSTSHIPIIAPEQYQTHQGEVRAVYLTGNNDEGWTLNLGWTPATGDGTVGASIAFDYYRYALKPSGVSDTVEMSEPNYIVYWVAAQKNLLEGKNNLFTVHNTMAQDHMDSMRRTNELSGQYSSGAVEDLDYIANGAVIGE